MNLILSPHFDDAVLSLGGLLAQEGKNTVVATFFAGAPQTPLRKAWDIDSGFRDSHEAMRERVKENSNALCSLGVVTNNIRNYSYLDNQYREGRTYEGPDKKELTAAIEKDVETLVAECGDGLTIFAPGVPTGFIEHVDHKIIKQAALNVAQKQQPRINYFLYQDLPYSCELLNQTSSNPDYKQLENRITQGKFPVTQKPIPFSKGEMGKKVRAIRLYKSQLVPLEKTWREFLPKIKLLADLQAKALQLDAAYCEVVYQITP